MDQADLSPIDALAARRHDEGETELWRHVNLAIVRFATGAAAAFYLILTLGGTVTDDPELLAQSIAPALVGGSGIVMLAIRRPAPVIQIGFGFIGLLIYAAITPDDLPGNPLIGLLIMSIVMAALVRRRVLMVGAVAVVALALPGYFWHPAGTRAADRAVMAFSLVVAYVIIGWLLTYLRSQSAVARLELRRMLASKDQFLATVSHELRTPVTTVVGLTSEMRDRWHEFSREELEEFMSMMAESSADIANLVEDLLVARADVADIRVTCGPVELGETLEPILAEPLHRGLDVRGVERVIVLADPLRVRQIVRNLLINAHRYGGPSVRLVATSSDTEVSVEVRDDGAPIPAEDRDRIFDAYYRSGDVAGAPGSVGLGLTVAQRLANLMSGDITYEHDGQEGIFRLTLPGAPVPVPSTTAGSTV